MLPPLAGWIGLAVGKFVASVYPVTKALPAESTTMPKAKSILLPPPLPPR